MTCRVKVKISDFLRYHGQGPLFIQQSTNMPHKVLEMTLRQVDAILNRDLTTQVAKFILNIFKDTNIMHTGFAFDNGAHGTLSDDCANKLVQYKAAKMMNRRMKIEICHVPKNQNLETQNILLYATKQGKLLEVSASARGGPS